MDVTANHSANSLAVTIDNTLSAGQGATNETLGVGYYELWVR